MWAVVQICVKALETLGVLDKLQIFQLMFYKYNTLFLQTLFEQKLHIHKYYDI